MPTGKLGPCWFDPEDWEKYRTEHSEVKDMIGEIHRSLGQLEKNASYLKHLDSLSDIKNTLMNAAIGKKHLELTTATLIFKIFGITILALVGVIVFLLTGSHNGLIGALH